MTSGLCFRRLGFGALGFWGEFRGYGLTNQVSALPPPSKAIYPIDAPYGLLNPSEIKLQESIPGC